MKITHKAQLLLLEDDTNLSDTLCEFLDEQGYSVVPIYDGDAALDNAYENRYDLLLLDVNVPGINGFELLQELRAHGIKTPAIFLTSLNSLEDLSIGYESGCDDYIRKPFALKELLLRVQTLLRREFFHENSDLITLAQNVNYDLVNNELCVDGITQRLQNKEALLLKLFVQRRGEVVSHSVILDALWNYDETPSEEAVRTYIKNLRKILGKEAIISVKKLGYKFTQE
ncbi:MAG: response regulator transcription factor [Sulfurospirillum sp.]|nr:response regulator transcription factor [Sulfurospirillum sp.]